MKLLIGNAFPLTLIRRKVEIEPFNLELFTDLIKSGAEIHSFWGHLNTMKTASIMLDADLTPKTSRPAIILSDEGYPTLEGICFKECWILSPEYVDGLRPGIGEEVPADKIVNWKLLKIVWI